MQDTIENPFSKGKVFLNGFPCHLFIYEYDAQRTRTHAHTHKNYMLENMKTLAVKEIETLKNNGTKQNLVN